MFESDPIRRDEQKVELELVEYGMDLKTLSPKIVQELFDVFNSSACHEPDLYRGETAEWAGDLGFDPDAAFQKVTEDLADDPTNPCTISPYISLAEEGLYFMRVDPDEDLIQVEYDAGGYGSHRDYEERRQSFNKARDEYLLNSGIGIPLPKTR